MRKTIEIIFCSLVIVTILTANVFASGWAGYTPNFSDETDMLFLENISSAYSAETLGEVITNGYNLGLYGGAIPIAVSMSEADDFENAYTVNVICVVPVIESNMTGTNPAKTSAYGTIFVHGMNEYSITSSEGQYYASYILLGNGDNWAVLGVYQGSYTISDNEKILLIKDESGEWYYDDNSSIFAQFHNVDATENENLGSINEKYLNALEGYAPPSEPSEPSEPPAPPIIQNYILDIPSIITAIPNGAKQIINNTFGFELFGINIAGLLSVFIIIAIVAYAVKKMMSR